jgi:hypothetical protein
MSKIEEIIEKYDSNPLGTHKNIELFMQQAALAFTKWKDENYERYNNIQYVDKNALDTYKSFSRMSIEDLAKNYKRIEQLFDEWNNLKTT